MAGWKGGEPAAAAGGAGDAAPDFSLPPLVASTEAANAQALSVKGGATAAGDLYGAKITTLLRRLRSMPRGDKAVVATSWPKLRPIVASALRAEGIDAVVLEGTPAQMADTVQRFCVGGRGNIKCMLLAVGTDCSGLTLTVANHLFVLDPVLSSAAMSQLIGRVARQGQTKPCFVYHFGVAGSIEERMIKMRVELARGGDGAGDAAVGGGGGGGAGGKAGKAGGGAGGGVGDTNAATTEALSMTQLLRLVDPSK